LDADDSTDREASEVSRPIVSFGPYADDEVVNVQTDDPAQTMCIAARARASGLDRVLAAYNAHPNLPVAVQKQLVDGAVLVVASQDGDNRDFSQCPITISTGQLEAFWAIMCRLASERLDDTGFNYLQDYVQNNHDCD
jgi:hypothetical protein